MRSEGSPEPSRSSARADGNTLTGVLGRAVTELANAVSSRVQAEIDRSGLNAGEFAVLELFWEQEEWNPTQLALRLQIDAARVSRLVTRLVDRRLLQRRHSKADRRVVHLKPTPQGLSVMGDLHERFERLDAELLEGLSSREAAGFMAAVRTVVKNAASA